MPTTRLTPNSPVGRVRHVVKTYRDKQPMAALDAIVAGWHLVGADELARQSRAWIGDFRNFLLTGAEASLYLAAVRSRASEKLPPAEPDQPLLRAERAARQPTIDAMWQRLVELAGEAAPRHHQYDFVIPWMGRELARLAKAVSSGEGGASAADYAIAIESLHNFGTAIAMWAKDNRIDLTKTTLADAIEQARDYRREIAGVPQGDVVYEFDDGWTVQRLAPGHLEVEGEVMQHCVGSHGYADGVREGTTVILSLRDPKGYPHATIEWTPEAPGDIDRSIGPGRFEQIQGKQNQPPRPEYMERIRQFIVDAFDGDPIALLMAGAVVDDIDWRGRDFQDVYFNNVASAYEDVHGVPLRFEGVDFSGSDFQGARLWNVDFKKCQFSDSIFRAADIQAHFAECVFHGTDWDTARLRNTVFEDCELRAVAMESIVAVATGWDNCLFFSGEFARAVLYNCRFQRSAFDQCDVIDVALKDNVQFVSTIFRRSEVVALDSDDTDYALDTVFFEQIPEGMELATMEFIAGASSAKDVSVPRELNALLKQAMEASGGAGAD